MLSLQSNTHDACEQEVKQDKLTLQTLQRGTVAAS